MKYKIILKKEFKSLKPFESGDLNNLTIITGKNGCGKSQLLTIIAEGHSDVKKIEFSPKLTKVQYEGIVKDNHVEIGIVEWRSIVRDKLDQYNYLTKTQKEYIQYVYEQNLESEVQNRKRKEILSDSEDYKSLLEKLCVGLSVEFPKDNSNPKALKRAENRAIEFYHAEIKNLYPFCNELALSRKKSFKDLNDSDFYIAPVREVLMDKNDLFSSSIELIFYGYARRRHVNRQEYFFKMEDGDDNNSIPDKEFITKFKPPWEIINGILDRHSIDFYFRGINKQEFTDEIKIDFNIYKKSTDVKVHFNWLSSGEKIIIGLILKLFTSEYYEKRLNFPELLVLDEPDAHLHPEMSNLLLDILENTFVKKYGIKVILTTHSPSTVALASEDQIYQLKNGLESSLTKISKDKALEILTGFIPKLSIDYKNHRQVFVESPTDRFYYQTIFDKLNQHENYRYKLYFISNGYGKGNCEHVKKIVNEIRGTGNITSYGVIDWDLKNKSEQYIKVHGENSIYSIENYSYSPLYLIMLFLEMDAMNLRSELGLDIGFNQYSLGESTDLLKKSTEWFFNALILKYPQYKKENDKRRKVEFYNGVCIDLPIWYLEIKGHELEIKLKTVFKALEKFKNEGELQRELTIISAKCYPFVHKDTAKLFDMLMEN
ncbi:ATP-dependent nuclease [Aquimarina algiphila]|uniref:ATP-dependent nuclease n=1 Tax=Aquimarina algiphila TaxID=2047982 RepID=UPI002493415E|nr:ATP-binding protein [Aquimarina algiphila]